MPTRLEVLNGAAEILGEEYLDSPDQDDGLGRRLRGALTPATRYCMEQSGFEFIEKRAKLSRLSATPEWGFTYAYGCPADMLILLMVSDTGFEDDDLRDYKLVEGKLYTDANNVYIRYNGTGKIEKPGTWTQTFGDWVSAETAVRAAPNLNPKALSHAMEMAKQRRSEARTVDVMQQPAMRVRQGSWSRAARGGRYDREQG
ncbi:MAG: hypothetical protein KDI55_00385 [Anaerolineae bacterium]|nr:hypothetical protein [Anaerolineae bacterium]